MAEVKEKKEKKVQKSEKQGKPGKKAAAAEGGKEKKQKTDKPKKELKPKVPSSLEKKYFEECVPTLMKNLGLTNRMRVPRLEKIVVNTSVKEALQDVKILKKAADEISDITGQKHVITKAKKSIANFKLRQGQSIGARVTLRGNYMYEFMNKLVNVALPRVRDFKGISVKAFDGNGNYTLGLNEQTIFPEIDFDKVQKINGMNITFVTSAKTDEEGKELLSLMGMPFKNA